MEENDYQIKLKEKLDRAFKKEEASITGFFIRHFRFTYLIIVLVFILGFFSYFTLPKEADPEVRIPFAVVNTVYPGANPTDIEELVTNKIEDEIKNLDHLKQYNSSSNQGFSSIFVEFDAEADMEESITDLKDAVDISKSKLPENANDPMVMEISFTDTPIVTYALSGNYSDVELKVFAEMLEDGLENVKDISKVDVIGGVEREFQVLLDQVRMVNYNISFDQIIRAISRTNVSMPAGDIEIEDFKYNIRVAGKFGDIEDLNNVVIATFDSSPVFLSDLALVKDTFKDKSTVSRLAINGEESKNAISIQLYKKTGGNIINIVKKADKEIKNIKGIPADISIKKINDLSEFIEKDLSTLGWSGLQTFILINIILLLVLTFRGAVVTALSVPIAFLMAFVFLKLQGLTLNGMVLFSLVLSLGLMVDNAIIIIEGIDEYVKKHKRSVYEAAILSVWNFKWPIISGTMTTVSAFVPMFLVSGIMGEYMSILPKTIIVTLLSSLFTALIIIPTLATRFIHKVGVNGDGENGASEGGKKKRFCISKYINKLKEKYVQFLRWVLPNKKRRRSLIASMWVLFIIAMAVPISGLMRVEMFTAMDFDYFFVNVNLPAGSTLEKTDEVTKKIEEKIANIPELDNYVVSIGKNINTQEGSSGLHKSNIIVNLKEKRKRKSYTIVAELREFLKDIQDARVNIDELSAGPPTGAPIEVRVFGSDIKETSVVATEIKKYFDKEEGVINARLSTEDTAGEFVFNIDKNKADFYGLSVASIASTLRNVVFGVEATSINVNGDDVDVVLKYKKGVFETPNDLNDILVFTQKGEGIALSELAEVRLEPALLSIDHRDGERMVRVSADVETGVNLQKILKDFDSRILEFESENIRISVGGEVEDIQKSFQEIFYSMILAIFLISCILVLQFNSFKQPFIIIFALPLAIIGVIIGLNLTGQAFSFLSFIGIVALGGIVVNDAIVLIDKINKNIANGMEYEEAIIDGGVSRMQPIFLTSLTTVAGIFPLIWADEMWRGFSITVISGLIFSTILTLVVMPVMYYGMCRAKKMIND